MNALWYTPPHIPWTELIPCPDTPILAALAYACAFWWGYRHPREF